MKKDIGLEGVRINDIKINPDERGFFSEIMRSDWKEFLENDSIVQTNLSYSYPSMVRAWHRHNRGQIDYFLVLKGAMKICAYEDKTKKLAEIVSSEEKLSLVRIPGNYYHGTKTVSNYPSLTVYFTTRLYEYSNPDEERKAWNDPLIIPTEINGNKNDTRCNKSWDWFYPPHK